MRILTYDIETSPTDAFVWRAFKENVSGPQIITPGKMICWAAKWYDEDEVIFAANWQMSQKRMVKKLHDLMGEADAVVTYNGDKFDELITNWEFALQEMAPPPPTKSIDMYKVVKQNFRTFQGRMDFVATELGLQGKLSTGGFELWRDVVLNKDPDARQVMEEYNIQDIHVLEELYMRLLPWVRNHPSHAHYGKDKRVCPNCGSHKLQSRGYRKTKVSTFRRYQCQDCGAWSRDRLADKQAEKPEIVTL